MSAARPAAAAFARVPTGVPGLDGAARRAAAAGLPGRGRARHRQDHPRVLRLRPRRRRRRAVYVTLLTEAHSRMLAHQRAFAFYDEAAVGEALVYFTWRRAGWRGCWRCCTASGSGARPSSSSSLVTVAATAAGCAASCSTCRPWWRPSAAPRSCSPTARTMVDGVLALAREAVARCCAWPRCASSRRGLPARAARLRHHRRRAGATRAPRRATPPPPPPRAATWTRCSAPQLTARAALPRRGGAGGRGGAFLRLRRSDGLGLAPRAQRGRWRRPLPAAEPLDASRSGCWPRWTARGPARRASIAWCSWRSAGWCASGRRCRRSSRGRGDHAGDSAVPVAGLDGLFDIVCAAHRLVSVQGARPARRPRGAPHPAGPRGGRVVRRRARPSARPAVGRRAGRATMPRRSWSEDEPSIAGWCASSWRGRATG